MWEDVAGAVGLAGKGAISGDRKQVPEPGPGAGGSVTAGGTGQDSKSEENGVT